MVENSISSPLGPSARIELKRYSAELPLGSLTVGVDNIHHDVYLSPRFVQTAQKTLRDLIRQESKLTHFPGFETRPFRPPDISSFKKTLVELMQASLTRAKYEKNVELDLLLRVALLKFLTQEISSQFGDLLLEAKQWIRNRGASFERTEQAHILKARLAELQGNRRNIFRQVGQQLYQLLQEVEEQVLSKSRRALLGDEGADSYDLLRTRLVFAEGGKDDYLFLEHYVLLGNYVQDQDRFESFHELLLEFLKNYVSVSDLDGEVTRAGRAHQGLVDAALGTREELARLEGERDALLRRMEGGNVLGRIWRREDPAQLRASLTEVENRLRHLRKKLEEYGPQLDSARQKMDYLVDQSQERLGDYLNDPENARRLFDPNWQDGGGREDSAETRARLRDEWVNALERRDLMVHVLASYELRNLYRDYCPPLHLQQLRRALVLRAEMKRAEEILKQFPARHFSLARIEEASKKLRHYARSDTRAIALRFAEDFMRLSRDRRDTQRVTACMERLNLIRAERTRENSRLNRTLYEYLLPEEARPAEDRVVTHTVIKADVRGSTKITHDLLARGLNPASHLSLNLYEPVKRILDRYGAAKVFIEGDAIVMAIFETESNRTHQRAVSKACLLARELLAVSQAYNDRAEASDLPRLELGVGIAFQGSAPTYWVDGDSRIMISRALNLSDRLSSCSKLARRLLGQPASPFRLFVFQTVMEGATVEEADEFLVRFNLNGVELNEDGFQKLTEEISLAELEAELSMPWGRERVMLYAGEVPIGETIEPLVLRKGTARQLLPNGKIGGAGMHNYYEVCTSPALYEVVEEKLGVAVRRG